MIFTPPTTNDVPTIKPRRTHPLAARLFRHYDDRPRGRSVLRIAGVYATYDNPTQDQFDLATEAYLGGHIYTVDAATATALTDAGYGEFLS